MAGEGNGMNKKLDFDQTKDSKALLKFFNFWLRKNVGKKCKTKAAGCYVCKMYALYDLLELMLP